MGRDSERLRLASVGNFLKLLTTKSDIKTMFIVTQVCYPVSKWDRAQRWAGLRFQSGQGCIMRLKQAKMKTIFILHLCAPPGAALGLLTLKSLSVQFYGLLFGIQLRLVLPR